METDYTTLTNAVASKVWETMNANAGIDVAPLDEQDDMVKFQLRSQCLPFITVIEPLIKGHVEQDLKDKLIATINESYDAGHDADFTVMALMAQLSDED